MGSHPSTLATSSLPPTTAVLLPAPLEVLTTLNSLYEQLKIMNENLLAGQKSKWAGNSKRVVSMGFFLAGAALLPLYWEWILAMSKLGPSVRPALMMPETVRSLDIQPDHCKTCCKECCRKE